MDGEASAVTGNRAEPMKAILRNGFLALAIIAPAVPADAGPLEDGKAAAQRGDYATTLRLFRPLAEHGDARAQAELGIMYKNGRGVPQDFAAAYMWFTLAIAQGLEEAQKARDSLAKRMTHGQIEEATLMVREWRAQHPQ
jgi:TPR repeat protein